MRPVIFSLVSTLLFIASLNLAKGDEGNVSPAVQAAINKIERWEGKCTLTSVKTIRAITFSEGSEIESEAFDLFAEQHDLESLQITNCLGGFNSTDVAKLSGLKKMKTLGLINCRITDASIKIIAESFISHYYFGRRRWFNRRR